MVCVVGSFVTAVRFNCVLNRAICELVAVLMQKEPLQCFRSARDGARHHGSQKWFACFGIDA
jgi:hypothetical protein